MLKYLLLKPYLKSGSIDLNILHFWIFNNLDILWLTNSSYHIDSNYSNYRMSTKWYFVYNMFIIPRKDNL